MIIYLFPFELLNIRERLKNKAGSILAATYKQMYLKIQDANDC